MKNIIIYSDHKKGHLIPTFYLADQLEKNGYNVFYIGLEQTIEEVKKVGFRSYVIFKNGGPAQSVNPLKTILEGELDGIIAEIQPEFILSTPFNVLETLLFYFKYRIRMVFIWSHIPEVEARPNVSRYTTFVRNKVGDIFLEPANADNFFLFIEYMSSLGYRINSLDDIVAPLLDCGHFITLSRELLAEPGPQFDNEVYLGPCIAEKSLFGRGSGLMHEPVQIPPAGPEARKIIYCAMGTGSAEPGYTAKATGILARVIRCAASEALRGYHFIVAVGNSLDSLAGLDCPANVHLYQWVPQVEVLRHASLALVHGGMGTIKECIVAGVPMLVTPIGRDQFLNARLVAHHHLGVALDADGADDAQLVAAVQGALADAQMRESIRTMKSCFDRDTQRQKALAYLAARQQVEIH